jgi:hypothetical protein
VILAFFAAMVPPSAAQGRPQLKRPEEAPVEKPPEPKKKKVKGPRAVGIVEFNSTGKGTLIPVAILVDGRFYDAGAYKADPVPMALESGTVYEVEQSGDSQGLFTVSGALHSKYSNTANPWVGAGSYLPNGTEAEKSTRKAEDVPVGLVSTDSDAPPRLTRTPKAAAASPSSPAPASSTTQASTAPASSAPAGTGSSEKPAASAPPASSQPSASSPSPSGNASAGQNAPSPEAQKPTTPAGSDKPADHADQGAKPQAPPSAAGPPSSGASPGSTSEAQAGNYYRPTLRRGKPTQPAPAEEDEPAPKASKPESPAGAAAASSPPVQLVPAISDDGGPVPRSYKFFWKSGEEEERHNQMIALAQDEVRAYANALVRNRIPATPAPKATTSRKTPAKPVQPVLENVEFRAFDVWANNQVVMVLTAEAHLPPPPTPASGVTALPEQYSITLVARTDIYGNLRKLYSGVTDKFHLDVTPRLQLIDAVDADGDGRGELLFQETTDAGHGYIIYRPTPDKLWKMFDSLSE